LLSRLEIVAAGDFWRVSSEALAQDGEVLLEAWLSKEALFLNSEESISLQAALDLACLAARLGQACQLFEAHLVTSGLSVI